MPTRPTPPAAPPRQTRMATANSISWWIQPRASGAGNAFAPRATHPKSFSNKSRNYRLPSEKPSGVTNRKKHPNCNVGTSSDTSKRKVPTTTATAPHTSQDIGLVERRFRTIFSAVRAALAHSQFDHTFWSRAAQDAVDEANYLPTRRHNGAVVPPHQTFFLDGPTSSHLQAFGQPGSSSGPSPLR